MNMLCSIFNMQLFQYLFHFLRIKFRNLFFPSVSSSKDIKKQNSKNGDKDDRNHSSETSDRISIFTDHYCQ